jgi:hypothetical protein
VDGVAVAQSPPPPPLGQSLAEKVTVALVSWSDPCTTYPSGGVMRAAALTAYWLGWHAALLKVEAWLVSFTTRELVRGLFGSIGGGVESRADLRLRGDVEHKPHRSQ